MKNRYLDKFNSVVKIRVCGSDVNNYMKRVIKKRINIIKLIPISYKEVHLILKYSEYRKLIQYKSIYKVSIIDRMGKLKFEDKFKKNFFLLLFLLVGYIFILFLSNVIFSVDVIHQDKKIRNLVMEELEKYDIKKYTFKKSYNKLEYIEDKILNDNKDRLEWIEIVSYGTKYIVRVEERKINNNEENLDYQSIASKKNAVIVKIDALSGEKVKSINDYVKAGDIVISGNIVLPNNDVVKTVARGNVYGEVWYKVNIDYPFIYQESNLTGRNKNNYVFKFFNKDICIFPSKRYKSFDSKDKILFCSNLLNICFVKEKQYELNVKDEVYTEDIVRNKAIEYIKSKMIKDNSDILEIKEVKILDSNSDEDSMEFKLFVRVIEDITKVIKLE